MPKIRTSRTKQPPEGYEDIESVGLCFTQVIFLGADTKLQVDTRRLCEEDARCGE